MAQTGLLIYMQLHKTWTSVKFCLIGLRSFNTVFFWFTNSTGCFFGTWLPTSGHFSLPWMCTTPSMVEDGVSPALTISPGSSPLSLSRAVLLHCGHVHLFSGYINCMFQSSLYTCLLAKYGFSNCAEMIMIRMSNMGPATRKRTIWWRW